MSSHGRDKRNDEWPMLFSSIGLDDTVWKRVPRWYHLLNPMMIVCGQNGQADQCGV